MMGDGWRMMMLFVALYTAGLPLRPAESYIVDILPMLGPRAEVDVVGLLDRSQGVGQHNWYYLILPFFRSMLRQYAAIHRDFARSAVVTFAGDATVAYDTISGSDVGVSKCELFEASPELWDRVAFNSDPSVMSGTNLQEALYLAVEILKKGSANRPNVTQVIVIVSDGDHENTEDPINEQHILESRGVYIFTVGIGSWLRQSIMRALATKPVYYADFDTWQNLLATRQTTLRPGTAPLLSELDAGFDNNTCDAAGARCYCDVDTASHSCLCPPGYHRPNMDAAASCQPCPKNSFKETPGSGPCVSCVLGRVTSHNGSSSRLDCHCVNDSCSPDPCLSISCPFGEHCVALDDVNTTCESSCQHSNCTGVPDVDQDPCDVSDPCLHGGRCYKGPHGDSTCWCPFNFRGQFCESPLDMCAQYKPCAEGAVRCITRLGGFECVCRYGYVGEFCQDQDSDPPFTGVTSSTANMTTVAMTTRGVPVQSSPEATDTNVSLYTTVNSTNATSLPVAESSNDMPSSTLAAIVVCVLIFVIVVVVVVIVFLLIRRRRQKEKAAAAQKAVVGPSTKPAHTTHNGTWSSVGSIRGLWKDQTWRGAADDDELPLKDRANGSRHSLASKASSRRPKIFSQNYVSDEVTIKNEQLRTGRSMDDWRRYFVQLETAGIIYGGVIVRPTSTGSSYVKTNGWTHDVAELAAIRSEITTAKQSSKETMLIEVQGEQFTVQSEGGSSGKATLTGICKAARTSMAAALAADGSLVVAIGALSAGDMASARCIREVQWIADMCGPQGASQ